MSSYSVFADESALEKIIPKSLNVFSSAIVMLVIGAFLLFVSLVVQTPTDIFSTGLWYDQQVALVFDSTFTWFNAISAHLPREVSVEGSAVGIMIWLTQIVSAIHLARTGGWLKNEDVSKRIGLVSLIVRAWKRKIKAEEVNWAKVNGTIWLIFIILFDTYTDTVWKTTIGAGFWFTLKTFSISLFINTFLSEWGLVEGFRTSLMGLILVKRNWREAVQDYKKEGGSEPQGNRQQNNNKHQQNTRQDRGEQVFHIPGA